MQVDETMRKTYNTYKKSVRNHTICDPPKFASGTTLNLSLEITVCACIAKAIIYTAARVHLNLWLGCIVFGKIARITSFSAIRFARIDQTSQFASPLCIPDALIVQNEILDTPSSAM